MLTLKTNVFKYKDANGNMKDVGAVVGERTTDTSLSQAGVAADAQAVGNKLSELSEENENQQNIPDGGYAGKCHLHHFRWGVFFVNPIQIKDDKPQCKGNKDRYICKNTD